MTNAVVTSKEAWIAPEIKSLDIAETQRFPRNGPDGSRFVDCTRS